MNGGIQKKQRDHQHFRKHEGRRRKRRLTVVDRIGGKHSLIAEIKKVKTKNFAVGGEGKDAKEC